MNKSLEIEIWGPQEIERELLALASLRIQIFRDFPYLYEGSLDYERKYLQVYVQSSRSILVAVKHQGQLVGASSALPLADETPEVQQPFLASGMDPSRVFYFGESVLLPEYRGQGLGHRFFDEREKKARSFGNEFNITCFCAVERPDNHPLRPANYLPLHAFWRSRGYEIHPELQTQFSWKDLGDSRESLKPMIFWMKNWG